MLAQIVGIAIDSQPGSLTASMIKDLKLMGISITDKSLVRSQDNIRPVLSNAVSSNDVVFVLLGSDPRTDRLVGEALCALFTAAPKLNAYVRSSIDAHFSVLGKPAPKEQQGRAMLPHGAVVFPNDKGIQPAYAIQNENRLVFVLPGEKKELSPIFLESVLPMLAKQAPNKTSAHTVSCNTTPQDAEQLLGVLLNGRNPSVTLYSIDNGCVVRTSAAAASEKQAKEAARAHLRSVLSRLEGSAGAIDAPIGTISTVAAALKGSKTTLAAAEVSPTPYLSLRFAHSRRLDSLLKSSLYCSSVRDAAAQLNLSPSQLAGWGESSLQTATALAQAARKRSGTSWGAAFVAPSNMYREGRIFVAIVNDKTAWTSSYAVNPGLGADYQLQYCTEELLEMLADTIASNGSRPNGQPISAVLKGSSLRQSAPITKAAAPPPAARSQTQSSAVSHQPQLPSLRSQAPITLPTRQVQQRSSAAVQTKPAVKEPAANKKAKTKEPFMQTAANIIIPQKGDGFADIFRKMVLIVAIIVFTGSVSYLVNNKVDTVTTRNMYEGLSEQMYDPDTDKEYEISGEYPKDYQLKFAKLWEQNPDIVGYLSIPNTSVNYPVVQTTLKDDSGENYYHRRDFTKASNSHGTPYADYESDIKRPSEQILIYGHNMTDGLMFGEVDKYKNLSFYQQAPIINFDSVYKNGQYKIFSVFITNSLPEHGEVFNYHMFIDAKDQAHYQSYIDEVRSRSLYDIPVDVQYGDELLTLSTCNYYYNGIRMFDEARLVVVARRVRPLESPTVDVSAVTMNEDAKHPDAWYTVMDGAKKKADEAITSVSIGGERTISLNVGDSYPLYYTIEPSTASDKSVTWTSSDSSVATVDKNGVVTAVGGGTAAVTVTTLVGGEKTDSVKIIVEQPEEILDVTGIYLNENELDLTVGENETLRVTIEPAGAEAELMWDSSDWNAVRVSDDGRKAIVSAKEVADEVIVSVYTQDGAFYDECVITVHDEDEEFIPVEEIYLDDEELELDAGDQMRLGYEIYPEDAYNKKVTWKSSNTSVATVSDNGTVTALAQGTAVITVATADGGYTSQCSITVYGTAEEPPPNETDNSKVTGVSLDTDSITLQVGDSYGLQAAVAPPEAEDQRVRWSSSDTAVAKVNDSGKVTAVSSGTAVITAATRDGGFKASCTVTVEGDASDNEDDRTDSDIIPVEGISFKNSSTEMWVGDTKNISYTITPSDATNTDIVWSSSDTSVAEVSDSEITAVGSGSAIISATTVDGDFTAEIKVNVEEGETETDETPTEQNSDDSSN
ncbi:MAG: Ig-like domain-containing protein [Oscillospiraceae bacterium]|nr:Ig-like domain-containing protein [Oscillospiraceae bacterium]